MEHVAPDKAIVINWYRQIFSARCIEIVSSQRIKTELSDLTHNPTLVLDVMGFAFNSIITPSWRHMTKFISVNIGAGNGLLPDGPKPLPEPILTNHQWGFFCGIRLRTTLQEMWKISILRYEFENNSFRITVAAPNYLCLERDNFNHPTHNITVTS